MKLLKTLMLVLVVGAAVFAQNAPPRVVTSADLAKYKHAREKADEDYRNNYARRGMPSPEELEKRQVERQQQLDESTEQAEKERRQAEYMRALSAQYAQSQPQIIYVTSQENNNRGVYYWYPGSPFYYNQPIFPYRLPPNRSPFTTPATFGPNVQMVRDAAGAFPSAVDMINQNKVRVPEGKQKP